MVLVVVVLVPVNEIFSVTVLGLVLAPTPALRLTSTVIVALETVERLAEKVLSNTGQVARILCEIR